MKNDRIFGKIFFPENPKTEIEAWLTVSEEQILLEASLDSPRIENWPLILGKFNGLDRVTFVNCYASGGIAIGAGGPYTRIKASYCIKMLHVNSPSELVFSRVTLICPALSNWTEELEIEEMKGNVFKVPEHEEILNATIDDISIVINNSHSIRHDNRELHVKKVCTVTLTAKAATNINDFANFWRHLKKLVLFLTNRNPEFDKIYLFKGKDEFELVNVKDKIKDSNFSQNVEIKYHHISAFLKDIVANWYSHKKLWAIIDLVLEKSFNPELSSQGFFLNVCVALETFNDHFLNFDATGVNLRSTNRDKISILIEDEILRQWFKEQSAFWKNPTLRERLETYRGIIEFIMGTVFEGKFSTEEFIGSIVKTRNSIAHTGEYLKRFTYFELFLASKVVEYTIRLEILNLLGVDVKTNNHPLLKEARRHLNTLAYLNNYNQKDSSRPAKNEFKNDGD